jgi:hypothetical protein|tara:strand:+ start:22 stop:660 length:639 start_codon:yes stop_codon:yes gene_type:complete
MGINSTEVAYGFGQMGSVFTDTTDHVYAPHGKVIVAVQFIASNSLSVLTAEKRAFPSSGTSHAHQPLPEFAGIAVAANDLGDCVIAGASSSGTTVTHTANTAGPGGSSAIKIGMQVVSVGDADYPRDGIGGQPVTIVSITDATHFEVSSNASGTTLSSQSLAGLSLHSSGYGGKAISNTQAFPTGIIIYGRWTDVKLATADDDGGIICYFGY